MIKVSVVVPVFNGAGQLARSAPTLLGQSLPPHEYEIIYVDDGSTDDSAHQLGALQAAHPQVVVLSQPNSGWPGRPRNVGVDHARGVYVQFVDQDDRLGPEALERLWELAHQHRPDIVLGKMGGGMASPNLVFKRNVALGDLLSVEAINTLTAHKMFRRQFLVEHGLRFPEGYWRGEDLLFMARAYAHGPTLAVLADYVCYYWDRHEEGHNSRAPYELLGHYGRLREIIGALRDGTEPGALQDRLLRRLYRVEVMSRLRQIRPGTLQDSRLAQSFDLSGAVARECFPAGSRDGLAGVQKLAATLLERGDFARFGLINERTGDLTPCIERRVTLDADGSLQAHLRLGLRRPGSVVQSLTVVRRDDRWLLDPSLVNFGLPDARLEIEVNDPLQDAHVEFQLFDPGSYVWWYPEGGLEPGLEESSAGVFEPFAEGDLAIDPRTAAAGNPLDPGDYWVWVAAELLGVGRRRRLVMPVGMAGSHGPWVVTSPRQLVRWDWSLDGRRIRLQVRDRRRWLGSNVQPGDQALFAENNNRVVPLALRSDHARGTSPAVVNLRSGDVSGRLRAVLTVDGSGTRGHLRLRSTTKLLDGHYLVSFGRRGVVLAEAWVQGGRVVETRAADQTPSADRTSPGMPVDPTRGDGRLASLVGRVTSRLRCRR